ncbi:MAG: hypothetical protein AAB554_01275 [Patescibacteria group bacterium]
MPEKKILWKSDLWYGTLTFGVIALYCLVFMLVHLAAGESSEAFAMGVAAFIPLAIAFACAFTDRSDAMQVQIPRDVEREFLDRSGVLDASFLNPDNPVNAERIERHRDKKRTPDIG